MSLFIIKTIIGWFFLIAGFVAVATMLTIMGKQEKKTPASKLRKSSQVLRHDIPAVDACECGPRYLLLGSGRRLSFDTCRSARGLRPQSRNHPAAQVVHRQDLHEFSAFCPDFGHLDLLSRICGVCHIRRLLLGEIAGMAARMQTSPPWQLNQKATARQEALFMRPGAPRVTMRIRRRPCLVREWPVSSKMRRCPQVGAKLLLRILRTSC